MTIISTPPAGAPAVNARPTALVEPSWLHAHLSDPTVKVVEVDVSPAAYNSWHIDGASLWNVYSDLKGADYAPVDTAAVSRLIERSGIDADSTVIFYGYAPALGVWLMELYGHPDARILNCSRDTWLAGGGRCSSEPSHPAPGRFRPTSEYPIRADRTAVRQAIHQPRTILLDVRSAAEYRGERFWPSGGMEPGGRAGHVPSAVHHPLDGLYRQDGSFRDLRELRATFDPALLNSTDELITYCTVGGRAATAWFVLTHLLGRDRVRVYDGSWAEWGRTTGDPVATGPDDSPTTPPRPSTL